jgi:hypothetical protein
MPRLLLYPFRFRDPVTDRWRMARYVAELHETVARHAPGEWEIIGEPEVREVDERAGYFSPWRRPHTLPRFRYPVYEAR